MNAKKIMGAVLVALLAAALFVGAGAAATVFINQAGANAYDGTWYNGDSKVTISEGIVSGDASFVPGVYKNDTIELTIQKPTVNFKLFGGELSNPYIVGTLIAGDGLNYTATIPTTAGTTPTIAKIILVQPNGNEIVLTTSDSTGVTSETVINPNYLKNAGKYSIYAIYNGGFVTGATQAMKTTTPVEFEVASADAKLSASVSEVTVGDVVKLTIQGKPNTWYTISGLGKFVVDKTNQVYNPEEVGTDTGVYKIQTNNDGTVYFYVTANEKATATLKLYESPDATGTSKGTAEIKINAASYTVVAEKNSIFLGNDAVFTVTLNGGDMNGATLVVEGPGNYKDLYYETNGLVNVQKKNADGTYTITIPTGKDSNLIKMDVGTYTFTFTIGGVDKSVSVDLTQPFLTAEVETPVVVEDGTLIVTGTAEATNEIGYYIFGNNKFYNGTQGVEDDGTFKIELDLEKAGFATGQFFLVVQHKMYDNVYNVAPAIDGNIYKNVEAGLTWKGTAPAADSMVVKTTERQNANAAEALCEALDSQGIDDLYVKATFIVDTPYSNVNPIPSEVTKGTKIVVSGQTNMGEGEMVKVTMASTAFGAIPKESNNAAAFISVITETKADGTWEVTLDTSKLNLDDYSVVVDVAAGAFTSSAVTVKVVEGTPVTPTETQPTQPTETQPTQTAAPETPGFGALAALAGLGAVAALLLRRE